MIVGLILGGGAAWWISVQTADGTLISYLPGAKALALLSLLLLACGWLLASVAPGFTAGLALGILPAVVYASIMVERVDHDRAVTLLGTVAVLTALGVGCAIQAFNMPEGKRHHRFPSRPPRLPRVPRHG